MKLKIVLIAAVAAMSMPAAGAIMAENSGRIDLETLYPADLGCGEGMSPEITMPDPNAPVGTLVTVHLDCATDLVVDNHMGTDCPGHSWSHWIGPVASAWSYTFDTTNPYGFSQATVNGAWAASNTEWESHTDPPTNIYNGFVNGGTEANSGVYDQYILAEFRLLGGQLRNAVGVQWAWSSGGQITHTDAAYNTKYAMSNGASPNKYDFQSISAHEMGHGFGMGHSDTSSASACLTVYPYATLNSAHGRTLGDGDILGIQARY